MQDTAVIHQELKVDLLRDGLGQHTSAIADKFAIDLINSIHVTDSLLSTKPNNSNMGRRILNQLTGNSQRHQEDLNDSLANGIKACSEAVEVFQKCQIESDRTIALVADKLTETRQGVMRLQARVESLEVEVESLTELVNLSINDLNEKQQNLDVRLSRVEALADVDLRVNDFSLGRWKTYELPLQCYLMLQELIQGKFGYFLEFKATDGERKELLRYLEGQMFEALPAPDARINLKTELTQQLQALSSLEQDQLTYIIGKPDATARLLPALSGDRQAFLALPLTMSQRRFQQCLISEQFLEVA